MKKLMFAAAAAAVAVGAFGVEVYDYKATVKHLYLKEVKVNIKNGFNGTVYQKYQTTSNLKGYLIMDSEGVTSPTNNWEYAQQLTLNSNGYDYGRNRGFLVVRNDSLKGEDKQVKTAKILPAVLDAKWIDTAFKKNHAAKTGLAEGILYVGGDAVAPVRSQLDYRTAFGDNKAKVRDRGAAPELPSRTEEGLSTPGMVAVADYVWTSIYLFGQYNGPNWFPNVDGYSPFGMFEYVWDKNLPPTLMTGWYQVTGGETGEEVLGYQKQINNYYHDTWMNGAGVGKYTTPDATTAGKRCCGLKPKKTTYNRILDTLAGNLKGGIFLCTENGIDAEGEYYKWFDDVAWEDQFATARLTDGLGLFGSDAWQNDLWQDGFFENETTDVNYGTWQIKYNAKFMSDGKGSKGKDFFGELPKKIGNHNYYYQGDTNAPEGSWILTDKELWVALYGAAYDLDKNVNFYNEREIFDYSDDERFEVPFITPKFAQYYRLMYVLPTM